MAIGSFQRKIVVGFVKLMTRCGARCRARREQHKGSCYHQQHSESGERIRVGQIRSLKGYSENEIIEMAAGILSGRSISRTRYMVVQSPR